MAQWSHEQGGEINDCRVDRLRAVGATWSERTNIPLRFHVLNTTKVVAYSWPTGDVYCSAGLLNVATDVELKAAIAHELGHMLTDAKPGSPQAFGGNGSLTAEENADCCALALMKGANIPMDSLVTLLTKVSQASHSEQLRAGIQARIRLIRQAQ